MEKKQKKSLIRHSRAVFILKIALPSVAFLVVALLLVWPQIFAPKDRFSIFSKEMIPSLKETQGSMTKARLFSLDKKKQPIIVTADKVIQDEKNENNIRLIQPKADFVFSSDGWAHLSSPKGVVDQDKKIMLFEREVNGTTDNGYRLQAQNVVVDESKKTIESDESVRVSGHFGQIDGDGFSVKNDGAEIYFKKKTFVQLTSFQPVIYISSENGLTINQSKRQLTFKKNTKAVQNEQTLESQLLKIFYREKQGADSPEKEIYYLLAQRDVVFSTSQGQAFGNSAEYFFDKKLVSLKGTPARAETKQEKLEALTIEYYEDVPKIIAKQQVVFTQGDTTLKTNQMTAYLEPNQKNEQEISWIEVHGDVTIITPNETVTAIEGTYDIKRGVALLKEKVHIIKAEGDVEGDFVRIDMNTGISSLQVKKTPAGGKKQRVKGTFQPSMIE